LLLLRTVSGGDAVPRGAEAKRKDFAEVLAFADLLEGTDGCHVVSPWLLGLDGDRRHPGDRRSHPPGPERSEDGGGGTFLLREDCALAQVKRVLSPAIAARRSRRSRPVTRSRHRSDHIGRHARRALGRMADMGPCERQRLSVGIGWRRQPAVTLKASGATRAHCSGRSNVQGVSLCTRTGPVDGTPI
jgi:hypothetical protein